MNSTDYYDHLDQANLTSIEDQEDEEIEDEDEDDDENVITIEGFELTATIDQLMHVLKIKYDNIESYDFSLQDNKLVPGRSIIEQCNLVEGARDQTRIINIKLLVDQESKRVTIIDILKPPENQNDQNFNSSNYGNTSSYADGFSQDYINGNGIFPMDTGECDDDETQESSRQSATVSSTPNSTRQTNHSRHNQNKLNQSNSTINSTDNSTPHMFSTEKKQKRLIGSLNKSVSKASELNPGIYFYFDE